MTEIENLRRDLREEVAVWQPIEQRRRILLSIDKMGRTQIKACLRTIRRAKELVIEAAKAANE